MARHPSTASSSRSATRPLPGSQGASGSSGYGVLPSGLSAVAVAELGERLDRVMARQVEEFGGPERMAAIGDALTARCPLA